MYTQMWILSGHAGLCATPRGESDGLGTSIHEMMSSVSSVPTCGKGHVCKEGL